ncbi:hypothetical protein [Cellulophaga baltica]|uniref:hypothetical protein n=1 Tax=Cellulophaga baltica TaxID=76594 RepID=UPI001C70FDEA|nr:hypothetical protein [Cellulophaga baltica]
MMEKTAQINKVLQSYFEKNKDVDIVPAKELMPELIKAGIFTKDNRNGKPIREVLRNLKATNQLHLIPFAHGIQKTKNTSWFFIPSNKPISKTSVAPPIVKRATTTTKSKTTKKHRDEDYIIDLCDAILGIKASRQHRFDFLLGDLHSNGVTRTKLPVDAYYASKNLVIEFHETQHTEAVSHFDKPNKMIVSGVHRGEQRAQYEQLRRDLLPEHGIQLVELDYILFEVTSQKKLVRNKKMDTEVLKAILNKV